MPVTKASPAKKATPGRPKDMDKDLVFLYHMITTQGNFKVNLQTFIFVVIVLMPSH